MANTLTKNQEILLSIKRIGINGEGIGYYRRLAVFVPNTLPGETAIVKITEVYDNYSKAELVRIKGAKSDERVDPSCPHYKNCGGCTFQHVKYLTQLRYKKNIVMESFLKYYNKDLDIKVFKDTIGMTNPYGYRNKVKRPVRYDGDKLVTGLYAFDTNRLVYIENCLVEKEDLQQIIKDICEYLTTHQVIAYNPKIREGVLRHIVARSSLNTKEIQVTLILYKEDKRTINIAKDLIKLNGIESVYISINDDLDSLENFGKETKLISGNEVITEKIGDLSFKLLPTSFFQLNLTQTEILYQEAIKYANIKPHETVVDCYCGVGSIALSVAKYAKHVWGIDNNQEAIRNAIENSKDNNIDNADFLCGDALEQLKKLKSKGFIPDVFIADPPRMGMEINVLHYLKDNPVKKVIYISCNPSTLAKNCNHLASKYNIKVIQPIDMFPQTAHVETCVLLERK